MFANGPRLLKESRMCLFNLKGFKKWSDILLREKEVGLTSVQTLSCVWIFATPWAAARQASLSITNSRSLLKLMSIESVMPSSHLILYRPLLLPSIFPFQNRQINWWIWKVKKAYGKWTPRKVGCKAQVILRHWTAFEILYGYFDKWIAIISRWI